MTDADHSYQAELAAEWLRADLDIREATERKAKLAAELSGTMKPGDEVRLHGGHGVRLVLPPRKFDPVLALQRVPTEVLKLVTVTEVSRTLAKEKLSPTLYADCLVAKGDPYLRRL